MASLGSSAAAQTSAGRVDGRRYLLVFGLVISLFFLWGVANNLNDILIRQFTKAFELSDFQSGLVQSAFYLGYFVFAIPAALFMRRFGYKGGIVLGLSLYAAGAFLFYPAAGARSYPFFLMALFVIASGLSFLETSANPFVTVLGPADSSERRLNLAQSFNPLGSITGVFIGRLFIFSGNEYTPDQLAAMPSAARAAFYASESVAVQRPYLIVGIVVAVLAMIFQAVRFPAVDQGAPESSSGPAGGWRTLARNRRFATAVLAQFFYVGGQVGIWSYLIRYAQGTVPGTPEKAAADYLILALVVFMVGRFAGTALMKYVSPSRLLTLYASAGVLLTATAIAAPGRVGIYALVCAAFFMSIMFPTIFALGLRGVGEARKLASSLLVMAIIGGAVLTPLMGAVSGRVGIHWSMAVPLVSFLVVAGFAATHPRSPAS
jgi:FHS family L-fucose permease-like MFS transporter